MGACTSDVIRIMREAAPEECAEEWDNVGLQVGNAERPVRRVGVALEVTRGVLNQAVRLGVDMLVTHHPLIFQPLSSVRADVPGERILVELVRSDIALYCAHTNLDCAELGPSAVLAEGLGLEDVEPISPRRDLLKMVVFVPEDAAEDVRRSLGRAGAGHVGNYSHCSFAVEGEGAFMPLQGADPFIGSPGELSRVRETRVEAILPRHLLDAVAKAVREVHPYEEPVIDVWPTDVDNLRAGMGRIGNLSRPMTADEFLEQVRGVCEPRSLRVSGRSDQISRVAVCGGAGADLWRRALRGGADVLLTGDISYHHAAGAAAAGMMMVDAGHAATEQICVPGLAEYIECHLQWEGLECEVFALGPVVDPPVVL
ncbi:MAG: Nif3-like dinuclear metal center hexameric protein [Bacillota bacterium]